MYNLQRDFERQTILACDDDGNFQRYISRVEGHTGKGRRHLAITVLLYKNNGQILLQRRKHKVFDNIWDFTGSTHPIHKEDGTDESFEEATLRCLKDEYNIENVKLKNLGSFNYFQEYNSFCENEHCMMMIGEYSGNFKLNPKAGYGYKWIEKGQFLKDIERNPQKYAPWVIEGIKILKVAK